MKKSLCFVIPFVVLGVLATGYNRLPATSHQGEVKDSITIAWEAVSQVDGYQITGECEGAVFTIDLTDADTSLCLSDKLYAQYSFSVKPYVIVDDEIVVYDNPLPFYIT